jgi:rare lipoprotein A
MSNSKIAWVVSLASLLLPAGAKLQAAPTLLGAAAPPSSLAILASHSFTTSQPPEAATRSAQATASGGRSARRTNALTWLQPTPARLPVAAEAVPPLSLLVQSSPAPWNDGQERAAGAWVPPIAVVAPMLGQNAADSANTSTSSSTNSSTNSSINNSIVSGTRCAGALPQAEQMSAVAPTFQVWAKGCLVAELPTQQQANDLAGTLTRLLTKRSVNWAELHATIADRQLAAQLGDQVLFYLTPEMAANLSTHPEEAMIVWVNNLRTAMGQPRLSLAQAQAQLHQVQETAAVIAGAASWYGPYFHGRQTANGEIYNMTDFTAAHRTLPLGTFVKVTNRQNGRSVVVRVNDRGPYYDEDQRIMDLSERAAQVLGSDQLGVVPIEAVVMEPIAGQAANLDQRMASL